MIRRGAAGLRRNWLFVLIFAGGLGLRILTVVAYRPAIIYVDSIYIYLNHLPGSTLPFGTSAAPDPLGYNMLLLQPALAVGNLLTVVLVQHVLGLAMAVAIYVILRRYRVWRWLSALAAAPVLLDAYQLQIEHNIMSDTLFEALIVLAAGALAWHRRPTTGALVVAGLALGAACTVRIVGVPLLAVFLGYAVVRVARRRPRRESAARQSVGRGPGWRRRVAAAGVLIGCVLLPVAGYQWYATTNERSNFGASNLRANTLYARVATFVDCARLNLPPYERQLCPAEPIGERHSPDFYAHDPTSPLHHVLAPAGMTVNQVVTDFSLRALRAQPFGLVTAITKDAVNVFRWNHDNEANPDAKAERWWFQSNYPLYPAAVTYPVVVRVVDEFGGGGPHVSLGPANFLKQYQLNIGYTPGPVLGLALVLALAAIAGLGRARGSGLRAVTALYFCCGAGLLLTADAFEFSWRYQLPGLVLIPVAGALALRAMFRPVPAPAFPTPDDEEALAGVPDKPIAPVAVLIAAYNEAGGIGAVLDSIPPVITADRLRSHDGESDGDVDGNPGNEPLGVTTIVVVDGGTDGTATIARARGAVVAEMPRNRGQGAALRLGYHIARRGGARYIVTTDADGQYDINDLPRLLAPLRSGAADFVTGSRRLGTNESSDQVRRAGTVFFAALVSVLTAHRVTDTSFGMRAMRADVTADVTLDQPQYQSSELLISLLMRGYRVVEVPATMRVRGAGKSKKGNNLAYGMRYARVVVSTWLRERRRSSEPLPEVNTNRSSTRNLATNMTANAPK